MSGSSDGDDVVEIGHDQRPWLRWPPRGVAVLASVSLLTGLIAGYAAGDLHGRSGRSPARSPGATPAAPLISGDALGQTGNECSAQNGRTLQLGVQVMNLSAQGVALHGIKAILPAGGLKQISQAWGPCGELPPLSELPDEAMPAGASTWFTVTFRVLVACPAPYPVRFSVGYEINGRPASVKLEGFPDLGHVPYSYCPSS